ncbi:trypsin-like peptidase domain-containing protein [Candidatus Mycoplasma pogonae]
MNFKYKRFFLPSILFFPILTLPFFVSCSSSSDKNFEKYFESVVEIKITRNNQDINYATGTIFKNKIISNSHIIPRKDNGDVIEYWYRKFNSNEFFKMNLLKFSIENDLALFSSESNLLNEGFQKYSNYNLGEKVFTIGNSLNMGLAISEGIISTINYFDEKKFIRVYGQIEEGNSGGPLFNSKGEIMGIISFKHKINLIETVNSFYFVIPFKEVLNFLK